MRGLLLVLDLVEIEKPFFWCDVAQAPHVLSALHAIADYCTTSKDLTRYLEVGDHSSRELIDAVLWCIGAVAVKVPDSHASAAVLDPSGRLRGARPR